MSDSPLIPPCSFCLAGFQVSASSPFCEFGPEDSSIQTMGRKQTTIFTQPLAPMPQGLLLQARNLLLFVNHRVSTKPAAVGRHIKLVGLSITTADKMDSYHTCTSSRIVMLSLPKTLLRPKLSPQCEEEIPSSLAFQSLYAVEP